MSLVPRYFHACPFILAPMSPSGRAAAPTSQKLYAFMPCEFTT